MDLFSMRGKTAIITGSSRGIGKAIAEAFADHGANVVISSRKQNACDAVAAEINERHPGAAIAVAGGLSDKEQLAAMVQRAESAFGQIDVLVCNAASNPHAGPMETIEDSQFRKLFENNVLANHWLIQMVAPGMRARRDGAIILISSTGAVMSSRITGGYCITKAAELQLARNLASEYGPDNVRVNSILPGLVRTQFSRSIWESPDALVQHTGSSALGRMGEPYEIAGAAVFLASAAGAFVTGQSLIVDGGSTFGASDK